MFKKLKDTVIRSDRGNATISRSVGDRGSSGQISVTTNNNNRGRARTLSNTSKGSETSVRSTVAKIGDSEFPLDPPSSLIDQDSDTASVTSSVFQSGTDVAELQSRFQRVHRLARGYKARYQELSNFYKVLQRERDNLRELLNTSQAKAFKRIDELKEEVELDKKAKQDVDTNFRLMLSEKDEIINVLRLQVSLLREGKNLPEELEAKITAGHELEAKHQRAIEQENKELRTKLDEVISQLQLSTMQLQKQLMEQSSLQQTIVKYDAELKQMSIKVKESAQLRRELADSRLAQSALDEQVQALKSQLSSLSAERSTKDADGDKEAQLDEKLLLLTEQLRTKDERIIALENEQSQLKLIIDGVNQKASSADMEFKEREADLVQAETKDQIQLDTPDLVVVPLDSTSFDVKEPQDIRKNEFTIPGDFLNQLHLQINNRREQVTNQLGEEIPVGKLPILQSNLKSDETVQLQDDVNAMLSSIDALITRTRDIQQARIADQKRITELEAASSQDVDQVKLRESELKAQIIVLKQNRDSQLYELTEKHKQELSSVQSQLAVQTESNAQLEKRLTSAMNALEEVKKQTDEVRTELDSTKAEIVAKDNEFAALSSKYTELAQQRDAMLHQTYSPILVVDTLCGAKSTPQPTQGDDMPPATLSKVGDLRGKLVQIKEALDDLRVGYTNSSSVVGKDVEEVNGALNQLTMAWEEKVGSVNKLNAELQNQLQTMHRTVALTKDELAATRTLCDSLEATANTRGKQIKELESNVTTLNEQLSSLTAEHTKLLHDLEVATNDFDELVQLRVERDEIMAERIMEQQKQMIYEEERSEMNLFLEEFTGLAQRLDEQAEQIAKREEQVNRLTDVVYSSAERLAQSEAQLAQFESQVSKLLAETRQPLGSELDVPTAQSQLVLEKNEELKPVEEIDLEENKANCLTSEMRALHGKADSLVKRAIENRYSGLRTRIEYLRVALEVAGQRGGSCPAEIAQARTQLSSIVDSVREIEYTACSPVFETTSKNPALWESFDKLELVDAHLRELEHEFLAGQVSTESKPNGEPASVHLASTQMHAAKGPEVKSEPSCLLKLSEPCLPEVNPQADNSSSVMKDIIEQESTLISSLQNRLAELQFMYEGSCSQLSFKETEMADIRRRIEELKQEYSNFCDTNNRSLIDLIQRKILSAKSRLKLIQDEILIKTVNQTQGPVESEALPKIHAFANILPQLESRMLAASDLGLVERAGILWNDLNDLENLNHNLAELEKSAVCPGMYETVPLQKYDTAVPGVSGSVMEEERDRLLALRDQLEIELECVREELANEHKLLGEKSEQVKRLESILTTTQSHLADSDAQLMELRNLTNASAAKLEEKDRLAASLEEELLKLRSTQTDSSNELSGQTEKIHLLEENVTSLNEKMADLYNSEKEYLIGLISSQRSLLQSRIEHLRTMLTQLGRAESSDLIEELQSAEGCLGSIDQGLGSMECPALWETVNRLNDIGSKIFDFEKSSDQFAVVSGLQDQLKTSVEEKSEAESLLMHVQEEYDALRADRDRLENELNTAKIDLETLNKSHMEGGERVNNLESTLKYYETNLNEMGTKLKEAETSVRSNEELVKEKLVIIASLEDQLSEAKLKEDERAACITSKDREIHLLEENVTSLNEKMADLYNSEKEYLIGLISSQRSLLQSRIEHLRTMLTQLGRAESSDLIEELQSAEGCLGSIDQGLGSMECPALWETVNRLNDIGSKIFDFEKSSDQFAVVSGLQDQLKTSVEEKSEAESLLMHVQEEYDALRADRDRLENELNTAKIDLETLNKSHMEGGERVNNLESTLKYYETNLNEMGTKLKEAETSVRSNEELVKEKLVIIASLEDQLSEAKLKEDERAACITSKDRELTELREQLARGIAEWQSKYESLSKQLEQMNLEKDEALSEARSNFEEQLVNAAKAADQEKATLVEQQKVQLTRVESAAANKEKQWKRQLKDAKVHIKKLMIESEELRKANALAATREEELTSLLNEARSDLTAQLTEVDHLHSVVEQLKADRQFVSGGLETASSQKATISPSTTPDHPETASIDEMRESYQNDTEALKAEHAMHIKEMQQQFNDRLLDKEIELRNKYEKDLNHVRLQEERLQRIHEEELRNLNQLVDETKRKLGQAEARIEQLEVELQSLRRVNDVKLKSSTEHENESNVMKEMMRLREQLAQLKSEKSTTEDGELQTHQHITDGSKRNSILVSAHESEYPVVCDKVSAGSLQLARPPDESYLCEAKTPTWIEQLRNEIMQVDSIESLHPAIRSSNYVPSVTAHDYEVLQLHNLDLQNQLQQLSAEFETLRQHCAAQCAKQHNQAESTTPRLSVCTSLPLYSPTNDSPKSGSLYELVEFEYLRNVLFQYMMGRETATLAKVLCSLMRFNVDQTKKILQYEDSRNKQTWILRTTNQ